MNKKGVTFIELIAVVAIMGILAVTIGGLLSSATTAYMRQKEAAAAKDLSQIVSKEIARHLSACKMIFLQGDNGVSLEEQGEDNFGALPNGHYTNTNDAEDSYNYNLSNAPFVGNTQQPKCFYSSGTTATNGGILMFSENGSPAASYFTNTSAEQTAFYGSHTVQVYFMALQNALDNYVALKICVNVYKDGKLKYEATDGKVVTFLIVTDPSFTGSVLYSYKNGYLLTSTDSVLLNSAGETTATGVKLSASNNVSAKYVNMINITTKYTHLYFIE